MPPYASRGVTHVRQAAAQQVEPALGGFDGPPNGFRVPLGPAARPLVEPRAIGCSGPELLRGGGREVGGRVLGANSRAAAAPKCTPLGAFPARTEARQALGGQVPWVVPTELRKQAFDVHPRPGGVDSCVDNAAGPGARPNWLAGCMAAYRPAEYMRADRAGARTGG